jgi:hypothetical protein
VAAVLRDNSLEERGYEYFWQYEMQNKDYLLSRIRPQA